MYRNLQPQPNKTRPAQLGVVENIYKKIEGIDVVTDQQFSRGRQMRICFGIIDKVIDILIDFRAEPDIFCWEEGAYWAFGHLYCNLRQHAVALVGEEVTPTRQWAEAKLVRNAVRDSCNTIPFFAPCHAIPEFPGGKIFKRLRFGARHIQAKVQAGYAVNVNIAVGVWCAGGGRIGKNATAKGDFARS